jgi:hypothetical protein
MRGRRLQIEWHEDEQTLYDRYRQVFSTKAKCLNEDTSLCIKTRDFG